MSGKEHVTQWQSIPAPEEGAAVCFDYTCIDDELTIPFDGFVIRFHGELRAYVNRCPHAGSPMDWLPGQFFSPDGRVLVCHTHGAWFDPLSGELLEGPACPHGLERLSFREEKGQLQVPKEINLSPCA